MRKPTVRDVARHLVCLRGLCVIVVVVFLLAGTPSAAQTPLGPQPTPVQPAAEDKDLINPDRPGIADGSTVIGRGRFQLETAFQQELRHADGQTDHTHFIPTLFRVGLSPRWEARFESNTFTQDDASGPEDATDHTSAFAPVSFGLKFHLQDSAGVRQPSLGTILRVFPASGTGSLHTTQVTGDLRLAADWDVTPNISLNPNAGVAFYEDNENRRFTAALFALTFNYFNDAKTINPFVDIGLQAPETLGAGSSLILDAGVAYLPSRNVQFDVSAGNGAHGRTPPRLFLSVGLSLRFRANGR